MVRKGAALPGIGDWMVLAMALCFSGVFVLGGDSLRTSAARFLRGSLFYPFRLVASYGSLPHEPADERARLLQVLATNRLDHSVYREAVQDNRRLRALLGFARHAEHELRPAQVVGRSAGRFGETLVLSRGGRDSVRLGQPVLGVEGLIGVVSEVDSCECKVRTLRHVALAVSGMLSTTREVGFLRWSAPQQLMRLEGIPLQSPLQIGAEVITSGHGRIFPKGIAVGRVVAVVDDSTALVKEVLVEPNVDLNRAEELFLMHSATAVRQ